MSSPAAVPLLRAAYPERVEPRLSRLDESGARLARRLRAGFRVRDLQLGRVGARVQQQASLLEAEPHDLLASAEALRGALARHGLRRDLVARGFALTRAAAERELGQRHYDVQLAGGWVLLHGMLAEMQTGEGKTLTATLPAATAALAGIPVHIVTVNDYLASRDAENMGPVYRALGLRVGVVVSGMEAAARRAAYACDVTYAPNNEVAFDYLKDSLVLGRRTSRLRLELEELAGGPARRERLIHRGLHFAIVDEADSVLVDEARTPLVISGRAESESELELYRTALDLAKQLQPSLHFSVDARHREVRLGRGGVRQLAALARELGGLWRGERRREELVERALSALHLFQRDTHYLVRDERVVIVDEFTGRAMPDRSWEQGLHQLIELKEGLTPSDRQESLARMSYQSFFRRYLRLAGMTGTAREVAGEMQAVYGLSVVTLPTNRPLRRRDLGERVFETAEARWRAVVARVVELHALGRPVLVGTRSVAASEHIGGLLEAQGLPHRVLNARQDQDEAALVARAGEPGAITVATNMAGRGTDIPLGPGVAELGGLHVIATERHEARRIDRQLFGRAGRQGDPGSFEALVSLEDELVETFGDALTRTLGGSAGSRSWLLARSQGRAERHHARIRNRLLRDDRDRERLLAFSGRAR